MAYILVLLFFIFSCGIKADTQVLPLPEVDVKRIGNAVYVISSKDDVVVDGFQKKGNVFYTENSKAFCFNVKITGGKTKKHCVEEALIQTPRFELTDLEDKARIEAFGFESFAIYSYLNDNINVLERKLIQREYEIKKHYSKQCYALTGVVGKRESTPVVFCIDAKPIPKIEDVEFLDYTVVEDRLFLIWSYQGEYDAFVVYQDGKVLGETKGFLFEVQKPSSKTHFDVKVRVKEGFLSNGRSITYSP